MRIERIDERRERCTAPLSEADLPRVDPVTVEIVANRLNAIAAEMGLSVLRTAHTILFAESKDFSCALFDAEGQMVAMAEYLPAHQGGMQSALDGVVRAVGWHGLGDGDIVMVNDALSGASHSQDLTLFAPVYVGGDLLMIASCLVHHVDMGGMTPSSYCPQATEIYQEGLRFPPTTKLYEAGRLREDILQIFLTNVRSPEAQRGDLMAQVAGCHTARGRLTELAAQYGVATVKNVCRIIKHQTAERTRAFIRSLPRGTYTAEDFVDGDGISDRSYRVVCRLTVEEERLVFDLGESDEQAVGFVNSYWGSTAASVYVAVMCHLPLDVAKNYGLFAPVEIAAARGTIVNPVPGAPLGACTTESGHVITDVAHLCLSQAHPATASGSWGGNLGVHMMWGRDGRTGRSFVGLLSDAMGVGGGGRPGFDGWHPASLRGSHVTVPNVEVVESEYPIRYRYRRLVGDAETGGAGAGEFRGGASVAYEVEPVGGPLACTLIMGRFRHPPQGVAGGRPGSLSQAALCDANGRVQTVLASKTVGAMVQPGHAIRVVPPTGGGYGLPLARDPARVREDVVLGYATTDTARTVYGVVLDPVTLTIDQDVTAALRARMGVASS